MNKVTVVIPVFNKKEYIRECINSVVHQTLDNIEILCVDDGSTDGSYEILQEYEKSIGIVLYRQKHQGAGAARNLGIDKANGEYIAFMDADDFYPNDSSLESLYSCAKRNKVHLCCGNMELYKLNGKRSIFQPHFKKYDLLDVHQNAMIYGQTVFVFEKEFLDINKIRYPRYIQFEDPPFLIECLATAGCFFCIPETVYCYRVGYKKRIISYDRALDILSGVKDCFKIASENEFENLYRDRLSYLLYELIEYYVEYALKKDDKIVGLLMEIEKYAATFNYVNEQVPVRDFRSFSAYTENLKHIISKIKNGVQIYGAGEVAQKFIASNLEIRITGIAVTNLQGNEQSIKGIEVKEISEFSRDKYTLICANKNNGAQMKKMLERLEYRDFDVIDEDMLIILEKVSEEL